MNLAQDHHRSKKRTRTALCCSVRTNKAPQPSNLMRQAQGMHLKVHFQPFSRGSLVVFWRERERRCCWARCVRVRLLLETAFLTTSSRGVSSNYTRGGSDLTLSPFGPPAVLRESISPRHEEEIHPGRCQVIHPKHAARDEQKSPQHVAKTLYSTTHFPDLP